VHRAIHGGLTKIPGCDGGGRTRSVPPSYSRRPGVPPAPSASCGSRPECSEVSASPPAQARSRERDRGAGVGNMVGQPPKVGQEARAGVVAEAAPIERPKPLRDQEPRMDRMRRIHLVLGLAGNAGCAVIAGTAWRLPCSGATTRV